MVCVSAHEVNSRQLKFLIAGRANLLVEVPRCTLHLVDFVLEIGDISQVFIQLFRGSFDRVLLSLQVLQEEFS